MTTITVIALLILFVVALLWLTLTGSAVGVRITVEQLGRAWLILAKVYNVTVKMAIATNRERGKAELWHDQAEGAIGKRRFFYYFYPDEDKVTPLTDNDPRGD